MPGLSAGLSAAGSISRARQWTPSDRERSALLADTVHSGRPLVSTSTRRHLFANLSMPVCAVKNSMRFKTQSILPYSMVLVRTSHLTLHRTQPPSIASQTTVLSRGSSGGYSCCTPVLLISRLLKYRLHHTTTARLLSDEYRRGLPVAVRIVFLTGPARAAPRPCRAGRRPARPRVPVPDGAGLAHGCAANHRHDLYAWVPLRHVCAAVRRVFATRVYSRTYGGRTRQQPANPRGLPAIGSDRRI